MTSTVLVSNRNFFKIVDLLGSAKQRTIYQNLKIILFVSLELFIIIPGATYFVHHIHNLRKATESMYSISAFSISFGMHIYFLLNQDSLLKIMNELETLVEQRKNRSYSKQYGKVEAKITNYTKVFTILITGMCSVVLLMPFVIAIIFKFQPSQLFLPFKAIYPFDESSVLGFSVAAVLQLIGGWKFCLLFCAINTFYIGVCWYVEACVNDISTIFDDIEQSLKTMAAENDESNESNLTKICLRGPLLEAVKFHCQILEFIEHFASIMDGVVFLTFSIGTIWLSTSLAQYMAFDFAMFQASVSNTLILVWLFVYCFYGHLISFKCTQVGEFAYHSKFYQYPIELKWFTIFMIARSQRPFFITGYRITKCSLESYSRFMKSAISMYMLFRNLSD